MSPLALSSSYFTLEPKGISITVLNSSGSRSPGVTSCQAWIIGSCLNKKRNETGIVMPDVALPLLLLWHFSRRPFYTQGHCAPETLLMHASKRSVILSLAPLLCAVSAFPQSGAVSIDHANQPSAGTIRLVSEKQILAAPTFDF